MNFEVDLNDLTKRLPRPLTDEEEYRAAVLLKDAAEEVEDALQEAGQSLTPRVHRRAVRVVRAMVAHAILVGESIGTSTYTVGSGPYSESVSWDGRIPPVSLWGEVELTPDMETYLGILRGGPLGSFPEAPRWPEASWNL